MKIGRTVMLIGFASGLLAVTTCAPQSAPGSKDQQINAITAELDGAQAEIDDLARRESPEPGPPEGLKGICRKWNCRRNCCGKVLGVLLCEPGCYGSCEAHNFACEPSKCQAVFLADPASATVISAFKKAVDVGGIKYNDECISLAEGNSELASSVCSACGGGVFCTAGSTISEIEGKCACAELALPNRPAPVPTSCVDKPCPDCTCNCRRPKVCHAECRCGKCLCLAD